MATTLKIDIKDYPGFYKKLGPRMLVAAKRGALRGGMRAVTTLHKATRDAGPANPQGVGTGGAFNTGEFNRAWKAEGTDYGARVYNDRPYAGVIEGGRRPGSRFPPMKLVARWAQRRLGLSEKEAARAAYPIAKAIAKRGLKGRKVMLNSLPQIYKDFRVELEKELDREMLKAGV